MLRQVNGYEIIEIDYKYLDLSDVELTFQKFEKFFDFIVDKVGIKNKSAFVYKEIMKSPETDNGNLLKFTFIIAHIMSN